jgi:hypothetical protein
MEKLSVPPSSPASRLAREISLATCFKGRASSQADHRPTWMNMGPP